MDKDSPLQSNMASLDGLHVEADSRYGAMPRVSRVGRTNRISNSGFNWFQISVVPGFGGTYSIVNSPPCETRSACEIWNMRRGVGWEQYREHSQQGRLARILEPDHGDVHLGVPICAMSAAIGNVNYLDRLRRGRTSAKVGVGWSGCRRLQSIDNGGLPMAEEGKHGIPEQADEPIIQLLEDAHNGGRRERAMLALLRSSTLGQSSGREKHSGFRNGPRQGDP